MKLAINILQDVLAVCSVSFRVQMLFCEHIQIPDDANAVGINILLGAAEGDIVADPEVQRAALCVLIHCVCAPVHRVGGSVGRFNGSAKRRSVVMYSFIHSKGIQYLRLSLICLG